MPTLNQVRTKIDDWVTGKWPTIVARQENYRTNRGTYWQGLITHSVLPTFATNASGDAAADLLNSNPTDQFSSWLNVFPEWVAELLPCAVKVDVYDGPQGAGWTLTALVIYNGDIYKRVVNVGPESSRAQAWAKYVPPTFP